MMVFFAILTIVYFFYVILIYKDIFLNFLNRRCISSMLFYFTKIFLNFLNHDDVFLLRSRQ